MSDILQTNIFFFITAVTVVVVTIAFIVALYYLIRVLKSAQKISEIIEQGLYDLREDVTDVRTIVREEGTKIKHIMRFLGVLFGMGGIVKGRSQKLKHKERKLSKNNEETNGKQ
ncbi:MAG: hypothetical protein A3J54_01205 [Candidatus Ryanbacteria bacterium RIFCSPHIGHO2_02_FULL_45_13b]|uniref:Uncharacterized protein n=1 Tax=Candidatus Ryanbacteria bacterium RIFCSPHIGHO2_02_FULL_45_13b TaxID=1802117 RepID=A0A1G2G8V1_9BACT|nr:MAG: hypothetical protein A3J54_01205 [Candidatus Ryanbacteria bacterium RIFCSPHIGHO2_02_FULL_45_13b]